MTYPRDDSFASRFRLFRNRCHAAFYVQFPCLALLIGINWGTPWVWLDASAAVLSAASKVHTRLFGQRLK